MDAPAVAVSADGKKMVVAWMDMRRRAEERDVFWRLIEGGRPGKVEPLESDQDGVQGHVALAIDAKGEAHAVWASRDGVFHRTFGGAKVDELGSGTEPSLAYRDGVMLAAYERGRGGRATATVRRIE
jgi:hypothetical protein